MLQRIFRGAALTAALLLAGTTWAAACEKPRQMDGFKTCANVEKAFQEGDLVHYAPDTESAQAQYLTEFRKTFPQIKTNFLRLQTGALYARINAERQGRTYVPDTLILTEIGFALDFQKRGGYALYPSPELEFYKPHMKSSPEGYFTWDNEIIAGIAYNPTVVKPAEAPTSWQDLLNPRWKGQMMWSTSRGSGAPQFVGNILVSMGQEAGKAYLQKLKQQNIAKSTASARQILDLVIAGEYPLSVQIFNHHAHISKAAGAPVEWHPLEPVTATNNSIGLVKTAPHPHAAMLFMDFVLSRKGQRVFQAANYLPAHPEVPALQADLKPGVRFKKANYLSPELLYDKSNEWADYFEKEFLR